MKRKFFAAILATMFIFAFGTAMVYANDISVVIHGGNGINDFQEVNFAGQQPVIVDGRVLVPVRGVFEQLGFEVSWNDAARQVTLYHYGYDGFTCPQTILLTIGSSVFTSDSGRTTDNQPASYTLDVPAQIIGGSTMIPLRAVVESIFRAHNTVQTYVVDWNAESQTVYILSTVLFLHDGDVTPANMTRLSQMTHLETLVASGVGMNDLTPLANLTNLWHLVLSGNQIRDLTPLSGLTNLVILALYDNPITDWSPVAHVEHVEGRP